LASLPAISDSDAPMNVVRSLRLPEELNGASNEAATAEGIRHSTFIRHAIEWR